MPPRDGKSSDTRPRAGHDDPAPGAGGGDGSGVSGPTAAHELSRLAARVRAVVARLEHGGAAADDGSDGGRVVARLQASVLRPLQGVLDQVGAPPGVASAPTAAASARGTDEGADDSDAAIWAIAQAATRVAQREGIPAAIGEAVAALQGLACAADRVGGPAGPGVCADRRQTLRALQAGRRREITVAPNGPYLVSNVDLVDWLGVPVEAPPTVALCRCGASSMKPWCDGSHVDGGFTDAKGAKRVPDRLDTYPGQSVTVTDNRGTCAHSGFCTDRVATAFRAGKEPFVAPSGGRMDEIVRAVRACPSGALGLELMGDESRGQADQRRDPVIEISRDGPYRVRGGVILHSAGGGDVERNAGGSDEHYSLCRCGHSLNKPFCSGMHWYVDFKDPAMAEEPSLFEWAGGLPALTRVTRLFFEKYVPEDAVLAELFGAMPADHPERVATWLAEAFGGPGAYSERFGGAAQMIAGHAGTAITEEQRSRWVATFARCADEAGLPADPEFRSALTGYLDWASRTVTAASAEGAAVDSAGASLARWDWGPAGRPRPADPAATDAATADGADAALPAGAVITFDDHIGRLFRPQDQQAMSFAFDLSAYADVAANAAAILDKVRSGSMPCDAAWPQGRVALFQRWVDGGLRETGSSPGAATSTSSSPSDDSGDGSDGSAISRAGVVVSSGQGDPDVAPAESPVEAIRGQLGSAVSLRSSTPVEEPTIVLEHREPLIYMLCAAAELEHALMCEYLFAAFSLKRSVDEGLTAEQLAVVDRWRSTILLVAKQEMLHLAINCNLVSSLGASPHLSRPNLPQPAKHYPKGVRLEMLPFGEKALRHFLYLERPEGLDIDDAEGLAAVDCAVPAMGGDEIAPHLQEFGTVGHLYRSIEAGFRHLTDRLGEDRLFLGPGDAQAHGELFGWPQLGPVTTCEAAVRSIEAIVEQGEGSRGDWRDAHFGRFLGVLNEYLAMMEANPGLEVARPVLPVLVRPPNSGERADLITDPTTARVADLCNVAYEVLLQLLYRLMCRVDEGDDEVKTLANVAVGIMFDVIEPLADILTTIPVGPEHPGLTAGPTFELFYQPDYLLPHRRAAWLLMAEHLSDAAAIAASVLSSDERMRKVAVSLRGFADTLTSRAR